jgi:hypothetical protein
VKGIIAFAVVTGSVCIIMQAADGAMIPAVLHNIDVPELSRCATWSSHRLFSFTQAQQYGYCLVLESPVDYLRLHAAHGGGVRILVQRAYRVVRLPARITIPSFALQLKRQQCHLARGCGTLASVTLGCLS